MPSVLLRDLYTNDSFDSIVSRRITEYDIKEAGYNLSIYYNLLPKDKIKYLSTLAKEQRRIQIGIYMRDDKKFNEKLTESFGKIRLQFAKDNGVEESDVLSIRKDAIFIIGKKLTKTSYGNVIFCEKNTYSSYHRFGKVEIYYNNSNNSIDVKGISDESLSNHESFIGVLKKIFMLLEVNDKDSLIRFIKKFSNDYKSRSLKYDYYREFNSEGKYALLSKRSMTKFYIDNIGDDSFDNDLDISYNYLNYILPLIQRFYFDK